MKNTHLQRIHHVCDYINHHIDEPLTLDSLSAVACCSKFHFHRLFISIMGVSVTKYTQFARLKRASYRLAFEHHKRIIDIALEASFESPEAFSRAFKRVFAQSPTQFRSTPNWPHWHAQFDFKIPELKVSNMKVEIVHFAPQAVALLTHNGSATKLMETAAQFIKWRKESGLSPVKTSDTYGIPYSDPAVTDDNDFRFDFAGSVKQPISDNQYGVKNGEIPAGRCALVRHFGSHDTISDTVYYLYRQWLPNSAEEVRDFPCFFHYLNLIHEVDECDLITDIYLPLK
ncbi:MAG: AraC family transcriptional regulator [Pseudoalteromonas rhizosphaerae]|jgi:AraC family transcriptional regulator|uniref:Helix-turn-helix domain-containing protein n=1 Tax=Pseudoalteromonas neustonica TaxID=1840331 RepID=A0ABY3FDU5_9GAMM|nr:MULTISPECIES: AraC family transcriptional regulator [Pseudoalteromonas]MBB1300623.1 AraC family transcriptional regulator [Pseudoalteromonas sp. SR44-8]MBB1309453.1 AraC family transcriptional regulator [Pseudoalteromonas sp. SR41-8]TVU83523.1 helix-turn-helix domain-containing protein [Pseudoalteromonas neustonica]